MTTDEEIIWKSLRNKDVRKLNDQLRDIEVRERWRADQERRPRFRSWEDQAADEAGKPRWGEL